MNRLSRLLRIFSFLHALVLLTPAPALAQNFINCDVLEIVASGGVNGHANLSCVPAGLPPCAVGMPWVAFDRSTTDGKHYLAMFMMAQATGAKVSGWVNPSCPAWQNNVALLAQLRVRR